MSDLDYIIGLDADYMHPMACRSRFARRGIKLTAAGVVITGPHVRLPRNATNRARPRRRSKTTPRKRRSRIRIRKFVGADGFENDVDSSEDVVIGYGHDRTREDSGIEIHEPEIHRQSITRFQDTEIVHVAIHRTETELSGMLPMESPPIHLMDVVSPWTKWLILKVLRAVIPSGAWVD